MLNKIQDYSYEVWRAIRRSKPLHSDYESPLKRCLTVFDLTLLGIGNMAGSGIYVLTGTVVRDKAGPSAFLSYMIAGITAYLNSICYAELGSRIPQAGSAYTYTYIAGGEFLAFLIGWSVILEYVLSVASVARGWSGIIDSLSHHAIKNATTEYIGQFPDDTEFLGSYPDFLSLIVIVFLGVLLSLGAKLSVNLNSVVTILNLSVILISTLLMVSHKTREDFTSDGHGNHSFMPYGFSGMIAGAGTCFYSFIGFDAITVSCEEALNPQKSMPIATGLSVGIVTLLFVACSFSLTLFMPWYKVDRNAAFPTAFRNRGYVWASYTTGIGSILGLTASLFTSMYAMPRIVYAMASDGLLPAWIGYVNETTQIPVVALAVFGALSAILAFLCDIHTLADFLSIGTLIAYTIASVNVCIFRYLHPDLFNASPVHLRLDDEESNVKHDDKQPLTTSKTDYAEGSSESIGRLKRAFREWPILKNIPPGKAPLAALGVFSLCASIVAAIILPGIQHLLDGNMFLWVLLIFSIVLAGFSLLIMLVHEQNIAFDTFKVPFVPMIPAACIFLNMCLIVKLSPMTWIRFIVWLAIGFVIYFSYGWKHSKLSNYNEVRSQLISKEEERGTCDARTEITKHNYTNLDSTTSTDDTRLIDESKCDTLN